MQARDRLIFALDVPTTAEAARLVKLLKDDVGVFKVGLELFVSQGPAVVTTLRQAGARQIFMDLKLHDIPATMRAAARQAAALGVDMLSCHCDQAGLFNEAKLGQTRLLGVTVLTSLGPDDLAAMGYPAQLQDPKTLVLHRAVLAMNAGCAGVVCSGQEALEVRQALGPRALVVCPGIRPAQAEVNDQKRVVTPALAIERGASHIVVGRPIRDAADPAEAARQIVRQMEQAPIAG